MDYQVKPVGKSCASTGELFSPGERCHSILIEEQGEVVRFDYSLSGWTGHPPDGFLAHWQTMIPAEEQSDQPKPLDTEALFEFFEQMIEDANPAQEKIKYVLSLLLMQKKRLKLERTDVQDEQTTLRLNGSQGEGPYLIRDQQLSDEEIQQVQQELTAAIYR
ncbi:MAG: hypothetical protein P8M30_14445 [Planctomycetaceae bacterium]|jgi:hypothetical protein|nr:hypothetical protein [Planctomycetaceae bacterium]MDG2390505.1 hypothetical protein [Planctomycetaceae bacterium]